MSIGFEEPVLLCDGVECIQCNAQARDRYVPESLISNQLLKHPKSRCFAEGCLSIHIILIKAFGEFVREGVCVDGNVLYGKRERESLVCAQKDRLPGIFWVEEGFAKIEEDCANRDHFSLIVRAAADTTRASSNQMRRVLFPCAAG